MQTARQRLKEMTIEIRSQQTDLLGSNNMFGTIAQGGFPFNTSMDFIPDGFNSEVIQLTGENLDKQARWLGLSGKNMQYWAYNYCAPLSTVVDRLAEADSNGILKFWDDDEEKVMKKVTKVPNLLRIKKLFRKPNPLQTWHEFNSQQVVFCKTFGYCPVWCIAPFGFDKSYTKYMFNLNPFYFEPDYNEDYDLYAPADSPNSNPISHWKGNINGQNIEIPASEVILMKDGYMDKTDKNGLPISKVAGLDYYVSNICAAMEADNVLLKKKGPLGVFSHVGKPDMAGMMPMRPEEQDDLQKQLQRYGLTLGQLQYVVSKSPVKWEPMSFNLRDLMTKETVKQGVDGVCDRFGYPAEMMAGKNATYDNKNMVEKQLYQNNIIPFSLRRMARYNEYFGLDDTGYSMILSYEHLAILKEDVTKESQAREAYSNSIQIDWEGGRISYNEARLLMKQEPRPEFNDVYYPEYIAKYPEMNRTSKEGNATTKTKYDRKITKDTSKDTGA